MWFCLTCSLKNLLQYCQDLSLRKMSIIAENKMIITLTFDLSPYINTVIMLRKMMILFVDVQSECHYSDVIISTMGSQITSLTIVYSTVYSGADGKTHQSSASMAFVRGIHWWPVNSLHKGPVMWKMFDDVIMWYQNMALTERHSCEMNPQITKKLTCCQPLNIPWT